LQSLCVPQHPRYLCIPGTTNLNTILGQPTTGLISTQIWALLEPANRFLIDGSVNEMQSDTRPFMIGGIGTCAVCNPIGKE
jgi:hypothetical protein